MDSEPRIIAISGISGVGKSTISSILMKYLPSNTILIRQDDYYLQDKPKYTLSNGVVVKNWDTIDAIDWTRLNSDLLSLRYKENIVLLEGFCLRNDLLAIIPDLHIHLSYLSSEKVEDILDALKVEPVYGLQGLKLHSQITASRAQSKPNVKNDDQVVAELVMPFYEETLRNTNIDYVVHTFIGDTRVPADLVANRVYRLIKNNS